MSLTFSLSPPPTAAVLAASRSSTSAASPPCHHGARCRPVLFPTLSLRRPALGGRPARLSHIVRMAPDEEKMTRRSPLDFPIEWERPKPGRRPDIFPQFSPMKTPLPPPLPADPPEEEEEDEEEKKEEEEEGGEDPDKENPDKPLSL